MKYTTVDFGSLHLGQFNLLYLIVSGMFLVCLFGAGLYPGRGKS
ncbi:MAG TPA: hypothetical protein VGM23_04805 [Armatimonadota bacterium]